MGIPKVIATWPFGVSASAGGLRRMQEGGTALDAVECAGNIVEIDPDVTSVGFGGMPNAQGVVELDAAIMDGPSHSVGAVCAMVDIGRPISVARAVMERSPHVMLAGNGAREFAIANGFPPQSQLNDHARARWQEWLLSASSTPTVAHFPVESAVAENHDTIGICAIDADSNLAAGCTTSGMAWKLAGRVGDSPIVGAGLFVDNEYGAAAATGHGDEMMTTCLSYRVVMNMSHGMAPTDACIEAIRYLLSRRSTVNNPYGAAIVALRKDGAAGSAATRSGFEPPSKVWSWAMADHEAPEGVICNGPYVDLENVHTSLP